MSSSSSPPTTPIRQPKAVVDDVERPNSPSPSTSGFSLIAADEANDSDFWTYHNSARRPAFHSTPTLNYFSSPSSTYSASTYTQTSPFTSLPGSGGSGGLKTLFPRIWDVLVSSPTRSILNASPSRSQRQRAHTIYGTFPRVRTSQSSANTLVPFPTFSSPPSANDPFSSDFAIPSPSVPTVPHHRPSLSSSFSSSSYTHIDYSDLAPLDGEEGELIDVDDEACFPFPTSAKHPDGHLNLVFTCKYNCKFACAHPMAWKTVPRASFSRARVITGVDIVGSLPAELGLEILIYLATAPSSGLEDILACTSVSKTWRSLALDNAVWKQLFDARWGSCRITRDERILGRYLKKQKRRGIRYREKRLPPLPGCGEQLGEDLLALNYLFVFQERLELDRRWAGTAFTKRVISTPPTSYSPPPAITPSSSTSSSSTFLPISASNSLSPSVYNSLQSSPTSTIQMSLPGTYPRSRNSSPHRSHTPSLTPHYGNNGGPSRRSGSGEDSYQYDKFEPSYTNLEGHSDSVYCVEFAQGGTLEHDEYIFTGSRDRTIKMWNLTRGTCDGTFSGHEGSVLCLKFFWLSAKRGIMYTGSSDRTILVWDVWLEGNEGKAKVTTVLRGHGGGVLDLRVDDRWVVSCSKDAAVRIWSRDSIVPDEEGNGPEPHHILEGHEGPVNALGLEGGHVVSASGDGRMILWDVATGARLRTFEGHDRGLACIAFKDRFIVSGSNDCKIKIWSAENGKCVATLEGHEALVRALSFDTARGLLVSASYDKTVRVWDVAEVVRGSSDCPRPHLLREFRHTHTSHIFDVKFDYGRIVSTSHDQRVIITDFAKGLESVSLFV
ncbi:hypothetical protein AAF712_001840 [Marasmius tenuissimus]|uniref:F-box domain-containing protein n=1 Tax=Marasmius tenuissimus TaxID=585030 RepID=A0ABR3AE79_9AGAR